jgi:release factor glutamine methyltransferase
LDDNATLADLFRAGVALLGDRPQAVLEAKVLLLRAARLTEEAYLAAPGRPCPPPAEAFFRRLVARRLAGEPLSHLTGTREFWSLPIEVSPSVLAPRPETEGLVEKVLELSSRDEEEIVDVGTGSGCIAIALAKELPRARIRGVDISERALAVARRNAARHKAKRIEFLRSDLLAAFRGTGLKFDFIVSNPPYVSRGEWDGLPADVRDFEPRRALLAGDSGLEIIERLVRRAGAFLRPGGYLIFEIGEGQRDRVLGLFGRGWTEIETAWDLAGKPRIITARRAS